MPKQTLKASFFPKHKHETSNGSKIQSQVYKSDLRPSTGLIASLPYSVYARFSIANAVLGTNIALEGREE